MLVSPRERDLPDWRRQSVEQAFRLALEMRLGGAAGVAHAIQAQGEALGAPWPRSPEAVAALERWQRAFESATSVALDGAGLVDARFEVYASCEGFGAQCLAATGNPQDER